MLLEVQGHTEPCFKALNNGKLELLRFFLKSDHPTKGAVLITDQPHIVIFFITDTTDQK